MSKISPERVQSNKILKRWCADVKGDVLSIGSGGDIDKQGGHYRDYFTSATSYTTSDIEPSMGTDFVVDARDMPFESQKYDAVFCSGVLEHVDAYAEVVKEVWRVLKTGGLFLLGVPFKQPIHRAPQDFWRFTEHGLRWFLNDLGFLVQELIPLGDPAFPFAYWAKAVKVA